MKGKRLILIDTMGIVHRAYHAYPDLKTADGLLVNAVYGFGIMFLQILKTLKPDFVIFASDLKEKTFRNEKYQEYKANRAEMDEGLKKQIELIYDFIKSTKLPFYTLAGYEADDIIGSIATKYSKEYNVEIVTGDKDLLQLLSDKISVILPGKTFSDMRTYTPEVFKERFKFESKYYIDYKAIVGDSSDNIKGAKGIGEKTATDLIQTYNTISSIYSNLDLIKERYQKILQQCKEIVELNLEIVTIFKELDIEIVPSEANLKLLDINSVIAFFKKYEFNSLISQLNKLNIGTGEIAIENNIEKNKVIFEEVKPDGLFNSVENFLFIENKFYCFDKKYNYFSTDEFPKSGWGFDIKYLYHKYSDAFKYNYDDLQLLAYCMDPSLGSEDINNLYKKLFHKNIEDTYEVSTTNNVLDTSILFKMLAFLDSKNKIINAIGEKEQKVYSGIDLKVLPVIAQMESVGLKVDGEYLKSLQQTFAKKIEELKVRIFESVGHEFNPNSTKELSFILFEELGLAKMKKIKTGYSTDERTISKLIGLHPIIELILEYREYNKLQSTYVIGLQKLIHDGRIHTELRQTTVATGRLSSINPNLQNIPVRSETGEKIRRAFIADSGNVLLSLDYSQIELRLMGEVSGDKALIDAFKHNKDIHTNTASLMFGIDEKEVSSEQRRIAKMINFGIIYGISDFGLSDRLGPEFNVKIAKDFINKYFERYPNVKKYFDTIKEQISKNGYVETIFGRRRYFNLEVGNYMMKQAMYREAINMPIQGADADIVKMSMIQVQKLIDEKYKGKVKMLLQIHDELLFEIIAEDSLLKQFTNDAKELMEHVVKLNVPMVVNSKFGKNWGEMK